MSFSLSEMVLPHVGRDDLAARTAAFYAEVDAAIAGHGPVCRNRGVCCRFDSFGHKLFVTNVEWVYFVRGCHGEVRGPAGDGRCPYQIENLCTAREHRPLGCRVFFCDPAARDWQGPEYERCLKVLKQIGDAFAVAYRQTEWLSALTDLEETARRRKVENSAGLTGPA